MYSYLEICKLIKCKWLPGKCADCSHLVMKENWCKIVFLHRYLRQRLRQTSNANLYHVTKFSRLYSSFWYIFTDHFKLVVKLVWSIRNGLHGLYLFIFFFEKFSNRTWRVSFVVNVNYQCGQEVTTINVTSCSLCNWMWCTGKSNWTINLLNKLS